MFFVQYWKVIGLGIVVSVVAACAGEGSAALPIWLSPDKVEVVSDRQGVFYTAIAEDADTPADQLRYGLYGEDARFFLIGEFSGELSLNEPLSVSAPQDEDQNNHYQITLTVKDNQNFAVIHPLTVIISADEVITQ